MRVLKEKKKASTAPSKEGNKTRCHLRRSSPPLEGLGEVSYINMFNAIALIKKSISGTILPRGRIIYQTGGVKIEDVGDGYISAKVRSSSSTKQYTVFFSKLNSPVPSAVCECPYGDGCKHTAAVCFAIDAQPQLLSVITIKSKAIANSPLAPPKTTFKENSEAIFALADLQDWTIRGQCDSGIWNNRRHYQEKVRSLESRLGFELFENVIKTLPNKVTIERIEKGKYKIMCTCAQRSSVLCEHKVGVLVWMGKERGSNGLELMRDWTEEKNILLQSYGYKADEDLVGKFDFSVNHAGQLSLKVLDKSIKPIQGIEWKTILKSNLPNNIEKVLMPLGDRVEKGVFVYLMESLTTTSVPFFEMSSGRGDVHPKTGKITNVQKINWNDRNRPEAEQVDFEIQNLMRQLWGETLRESLRFQGYTVPSNYQRWNEETLQGGLDLTGKILEQLFPLLTERAVFISTGHTVGAHLQASTSPLYLQFKLTHNGSQQTEFQAFVRHKDPETLIPLSQLKDIGTYWLAVKDDNTLCRFANTETAKLARYFFECNGAIRLRTTETESFFNEFILPIANRFPVEFDERYTFDQQEIDYREGRIYLKEEERFLCIVPVFAYDIHDEEIELERDFQTVRVAHDNGKVYVQHRDLDQENEFMDFLETLHPEFKNQTGRFFYLPFEKVLENNWLFAFFETLLSNETKVLGFNTLKRFRYNPNRANIKMRTSSGLDWFDLKVDVSFGEISVPLAEVRKAILKKQNYVELNDGSLGILPADWVEKYAQLFRLGHVDGKKETVRLSKLHFTILDSYSELIDDEAILKELHEKKKKLLNFSEIEEILLPK